jgi:hypothetical protein
MKPPAPATSTGIGKSFTGSEFAEVPAKAARDDSCPRNRTVRTGFNEPMD